MTVDERIELNKIYLESIFRKLAIDDLNYEIAQNALLNHVTELYSQCSKVNSTLPRMKDIITATCSFYSNNKPMQEQLMFDSNCEERLRKCIYSTIIDYIVQKGTDAKLTGHALKKYNLLKANFIANLN